MFSIKSTEGKKKHEEDISNSFYHPCLDHVFSDKNISLHIDNIDYLVDRALAQHSGRRKNSSIIKKRLPVKKILAIALTLSAVLAAIPYILPPLYGDFHNDLRIELNPSDGVRLNDTLYVNLTIPVGYNITSVNADMAGVETVDLLFVCNDSVLQFWQGVWFVHSLDPGEYIIDIFAVDNVNVSYHAGVGLNVLADEILPSAINESGSGEVNISDNDTQPHDIDANDTFPPEIDSGNVSKNESKLPAGLNLSIMSDKLSYVVNETVLISGVVRFNNSVIDGSVDLFITSIGLGSSEIVNVSEGRFEYAFIPVVAGDYNILVNISYENLSNEDDLMIVVENRLVENFTEHISEISIINPVGREVVFVVPGSSFYVERTIEGRDGLQAVFALLFSDGLTIERFAVAGGNVTRGRGRQSVSDIASNVFVSGRGVSYVERRIDNLRERLPSDIKDLDYAAYSGVFVLRELVTIRIWFRAPSWEDIVSGRAPSSGRISYLTFSDDSFDFEGSTWWNSNWVKRKLITVNSSQVEADLTNFPILVNITDAELAKYAQDDGDDIAFILYSDNTTQLNHEIELFNITTGNLVTWVNITSLSSSIDTMIWMFYNNSVCSSQQNVVGTWNDNYIMIQHLNETSSTHLDSTNNNNDDAGKSVNIQGSAIGQINGADDFDDTNSNYVTFTTSGMVTSAGSVSLWGNMDSSTGVRSYFFSHRTGSNNNRIYLFEESGTLFVGFADVFQNNIGYTINPDEWHFYTLTWSGANWNVYVDGNLEGGNASATLSGIDANCHLGSYIATQEWFDGIIDEVRISNIPRNASWINTCYNTMKNMTTFLSISSEENITDTSVDTISPYNVTYSPFTITATGADGLDNVTLWYRYSSDNSSWDDWIQNVTDTISPWSWSFNFPNGTGYYEFYSIGNLSGFSDEAAPSSADAICYFNSSINTPPTIELINPSPNGTTEIGILPMCQIWANDSDSSTLDVYWFENSTGSFILRNTNSSISANSTVSYTFTEFSNYFTTYWWKVAVNDSEDNTSAIYYFTTTSIDTSVDIISPYIVSSSPLALSATGSSDLDEVTLFYRWSDDNISWGHSGEITYDTPVIDNIASETENTAATSMSWLHTVSSGLDNSILIVGVNLEDDDAGDNYFVSSADFNGDALSFAERAAADEGFAAISEIWYLLSPDAGSYTITVNFSVAINNAFGGSVSFSNVNQSIPDDTNSSMDIGDPSGLSTGASTVAPNSLIIAIATDGNSGFTYSYGSEQSEIYNVDGSTHHGAGSYRIPSGTGSFMMYTNLSGATNRMSEVVALWAPSSILWGNGSNWAVWSNVSNPDTGLPWGWGFDFPNGTGYYEFYSIGNKSGSPNETAPVIADAICYYNASINISIDIIPYQWDIGTTTIGSYNYSTSEFYFNLTNNGTVSVNIQIKASNATNVTTGSVWNLTSTPSHDNYSLQYNTSGGFSWKNINQTYDTFVTNLGVRYWQTFDLNIFMATASTKNDPLSIKITFRSVVV